MAGAGRTSSVDAVRTLDEREPTARARLASSVSSLEDEGNTAWKEEKTATELISRTSEEGDNAAEAGPGLWLESNSTFAFYSPMDWDFATTRRGCQEQEKPEFMRIF
jgi:hypothetical protein